MRLTNVNNGLKVQAIAGTYAVLLGFDLLQADCSGLLGFSIHRIDHTENEAYYLSASKAFKETDPGFSPGMQYSTRDHPIQSFQWADYTAKPGHIYTYTITALKGSPANLISHAETIVPVVTESPQSGDHDIYFNRGVAASQAYVRRFGDKRPADVPNGKAWEWLSRGLNEALEEYIRSCIPGRNALRIAAYEFNFKHFLDLIKEVVDSGVDIQIVFDARQDNPKIENEKAVTIAGLDAVCFKRTQQNHTSPIINSLSNYWMANPNRFGPAEPIFLKVEYSVTPTWRMLWKKRQSHRNFWIIGMCLKMTRRVLL